MGLFPIIMNILQFWLIDSIVKASTVSPVALDEDGPDVYSNHDREPLFRASSDDEDDNEYRPGDIENGRLNARSRSPTRDKTAGKSTPEEHKSSPANTSEEATDHSYPPSLTSSTSSNRGAPPRPATNLLKKANRRAAPAPLSLRTHSTPAVNSPSLSVGVSAVQTALPHVPLVPVVAPIPQVAPVNEDAWAETWDDSDDWANRVGEEEWTGRRIEQKKDILHGAWDSHPTIQVGS